MQNHKKEKLKYADCHIAQQNGPMLERIYWKNIIAAIFQANSIEGNKNKNMKP